MTKATVPPREIHLISVERYYVPPDEEDGVCEYKIFGSYSELGKWIELLGEDTMMLRVALESEGFIGEQVIKARWDQ